MELKVLDGEFTICRVKSVPDPVPGAGPWFLAGTDEEVSLVCLSGCVPAETAERSDGWRGFRVRGVLDFSQTGILSSLSGVLAGEGIGIFAVSTFQTDYIFVKKEHFSGALEALRRDGHTIS